MNTLILGTLSGPASGTLGVSNFVNVPSWCWDDPGFKEWYEDICWSQANLAVAQVKETNEGAFPCFDGGEYVGDEECHRRILNQCTQQGIAQFCPWTNPPGTGTRVCSVENVQNALNALGAKIDVDGNWGPQTQAAFVASGKTCAELVASCTKCPTSAAPALPPVPPGEKPPTVTPVGYEQTAKKSNVLPWVLGGVAVAVAVGAVMITTTNK